MAPRVVGAVSSLIVAAAGPASPAAGQATGDRERVELAHRVGWDLPEEADGTGAALSAGGRRLCLPPPLLLFPSPQFITAES